MKCRKIIDPQRDEEEVLLYLKKDSPLADEIVALVESRQRVLTGYREQEIVPIHPTDVLCFTVENKKVYARLSQETLLIKLRLYQLEEMLGERFVKLNQSCLANMAEIERFQVSVGGALTVIFRNGYRDYVSRRQLTYVKERFGI